MTKIFAHRGYSGKYPENTMLAFRKAVEAGAEGIELDVQLSSDGVPVIIHDELVDRTTDGKGRVNDYSLEELKKLDASYIYTGTYGVNRIPTFREYCEYIQDKPVITNIEMKTGVLEYLGIEQKVIDMIHEFHLEDKVIISSFNHFTIKRMMALEPSFKYGFLSETWIIEAGKYCHEQGVPCYHPLFRNLIPELVQEIKSYGLQINTYTVNTPEDVQDMINKKIDIIISNFPEMALEVRNKNL